MSDKRIFLALGSNLGNRLEHLKSALKYLETHGVRIEAKSRVWETAPWGVTDQPAFLNMCAAARTTLDPFALLRLLKNAEAELGRSESWRWGPREIASGLRAGRDGMDHGNIKKPAHGGTGKKNLGFLFLPAAVVIMALVLLLTPRPEGERREITLRTLELPAFPITLVLEENEGETAAAWLRTPAGARRIEQVEGLSFISSDPVVSRADQDDSDDLLWRISFMNVKGEGIHLWIGMTTWAPRVYVAATPFQYTRWHALPRAASEDRGPEGDEPLHLARRAALPDARKAVRRHGQLFVRLHDDADARGAELRPSAVGLQTARRPAARGDARRKLAAEAPRLRPYADVLTEFNRLADGKAPQADTLLNLQIERIDTLSWKK